MAYGNRRDLRRIVNSVAVRLRRGRPRPRHDDTGGWRDSDGAGGHIGHDHSVGPDARTVTDTNRPDNHRAGADMYLSPESRPVIAVIADAAKSHVLPDQAVVPDHR